jgi:hypothetical protein
MLLKNANTLNQKKSKISKSAIKNLFYYFVLRTKRKPFIKRNLKSQNQQSKISSGI